MAKKTKWERKKKIILAYESIHPIKDPKIRPICEKLEQGEQIDHKTLEGFVCLFYPINNFQLDRLSRFQEPMPHEDFNSIYVGLYHMYGSCIGSLCIIYQNNYDGLVFRRHLSTLLDDESFENFTGDEKKLKKKDYEWLILPPNLVTENLEAAYNFLKDQSKPA